MLIESRHPLEAPVLRHDPRPGCHCLSDAAANVAALRSRLQKAAAADLTDLSVDVYRVQSGDWARV